MNIFIQASLVGYAACLNYGGIPDYVKHGCWVNKDIYHNVMADLKDRKFVYGVGSGK
jgi:hypothetical protein